MPRPRKIRKVLRREERLSRGGPCLLLCAALFLTGGCAGRKFRAFPWQTAAVVRPRLPDKPAAPPVEEPPLDLEPAIPPPSRVILARSTPPRPPAAPANGSEADPRGAVPSMAPQLTAAESAAAEQETDRSLRAAEENLGRFRGRTLTPAQSEMAGKTRDFIRQARKAAREKDWVRARNLAEKAQLLSKELLRSP